MNVPVFIDINQDEQVEELRAYFKSLVSPFSILLNAGVHIGHP